MLRRVILPLGVAACSLTTDLSGLSDGAKDAGLDATGDATADASPDAGGSDAGAAAFCASKASDASAVHFCTDFDEAGVASGWSNESLAPGAIVLDDASSVSPPFSARFEMDAGAASCSYTTLFKDFTATVSSIHVEAAVFLDPDNVGPFVNGTLFLAGKHVKGKDDLSLYVDADPKGLSMHEQESLPDGGELDFNHDTTVSVPPHTWSVVALDADFAAGTFSLRLDGQVLFDKEPLDPSARGAGTPYLQVGFACDVGLPYVRNARYDDVLIDGK
jgi:hypothetical protein